MIEIQNDNVMTVQEAMRASNGEPISVEGSGDGNTVKGVNVRGVEVGELIALECTVVYQGIINAWGEFTVVPVNSTVSIQWAVNNEIAFYDQIGEDGETANAIDIATTVVESDGQSVLEFIAPDLGENHTLVVEVIGSSD